MQNPLINNTQDREPNGAHFKRDKLENVTGYATLIGFYLILSLYVFKEVTGTKFFSPDVVIFLFGFFTSEIKSISIGRGEGYVPSKMRADLLSAMLALIITFHFF